MPKLRIKGLERDLDVPAGANLHEACRKSHVNLFWSPWARLFNCRGIGLCGSCPVRVLQGGDKLHAPTKKEVKRLRNRPEDWRLACQVKVEGDLRIEPFPLESVKERLGEEPLRRAQMEPEEREELFQREREQRLEARRVKVDEFLATRKRKRSKIVGFFAKRLKKDEEKEPGEKKEKPEKKKDGGLAGRLRKKGSEKEDTQQKEKGEGKKKPPKKKKPAKEKDQQAPKEKDKGKDKAEDKGKGKGKGGFKLGKKGKKGEKQQTAPGPEAGKQGKE